MEETPGKGVAGVGTLRGALRVKLRDEGIKGATNMYTLKICINNRVEGGFTL